MEVSAVPEAGFGLTALPGRGIERRLTPANVANGLNIVRATAKAFRVLRRFDAGLVVSLGGYAAVPAGVAAVTMGIPIVIQEQNAKASLANRLVGRFAKHSAVLVEGTGLRNEVATGNPLRPEIREAADLGSEQARSRLGVSKDQTLMVAFGGSLGSLRINLATIELAESLDERGDLLIHHVVGSRDWPVFRERIDSLERSGLNYRAVEYENDMATVLAAADFAVCRAGGMAVSELAALSVPAILVPLPIAPNDAQRHNAKALCDAGAAVVVDDSDLDGRRLGLEVDDLISDGLELKAAAARSVAKLDAADRVAELVLGTLRDR